MGFPPPFPSSLSRIASFATSLWTPKQKLDREELRLLTETLLLFLGLNRADDKMASEYGLEGGVTLHLVLALRGGDA